MILSFIFAFCTVFITCHSLVIRWVWKKSRSPQVLLLKLILVFDIFFAFSGLMINDWIAWIYGLIVIHCFYFSYFITFQLSETGRRIKILILLNENPQLRIDSLKTSYSVADMVTHRIDRLKKMNQIRETTSGRYIISSFTLLVIAKCFRCISIAVVGSKNRII